MHVAIVILIVIAVLGAIGGLTYLFTTLLVGQKSEPSVPTKPLPQPTHTLSEYNPVEDGNYLKIQSYDSPGNNIIAWQSPDNFGMTLDKCKQRCDQQKDCVAFGYDPKQKNYCTSKTTYVLPLAKWSGDLYIKKSKVPSYQSTPPSTTTTTNNTISQTPPPPTPPSTTNNNTTSQTPTPSPSPSPSTTSTQKSK